MDSTLNFKQLITYMMKCNRIGYYASRQNMLRNGASQHDVAKMLAFRLRYLSQSQSLSTPT